jgi:hypothetical protein
MDDSTEQRIRERAYALWEKEGAPHGRDAEFWERARQMVEADAAAPPATPAKGRPRRESATDKASEESFPASDPPAFTGTTAGAAGSRKRKR